MKINIFKRRHKKTTKWKPEELAIILYMLKRDFDMLTRHLSSFPVGHPLDSVNPAVRKQRNELHDWNYYARTLHYDIGIDIENIDKIINEYFPNLPKYSPEKLDDIGSDEMC